MNKKIYSGTGTPFTDIFKVDAKGANVDIETLTKLPELINTPIVNEGNVAFYPNGYAMVFAKGNSGRSSDHDQVNLFYTRYRNGKWLNPKFLEINEPKYWDSTPFVSRDGKTLYFASDRPGGYGGTDIYSAKLNPRGRWVDVRNMGDHINTPENELFPTVGVDGRFYFASDGHPGFGRLDLFVVKREHGVTIIENLGKPINSSGDDFALFEFDEIRGFFASNREGGKGDDDVYTFYNKDPDLKIVNYYLTGTTVTENEEGNEEILANAKIIMYSTINDEILDETFSNTQGRFKFKVYEDENYVLLASKDNYFTTRSTFSTIGKAVDRSTLTKRVTNVKFETKIQLNQIVIDKPIVLRNIYYDLDKADIRPDAAIELNKLVTLMRDNPSIEIELSSHTDARASDDYNLDLSERRAKSAVDYLVSEGISQSRMIAKGYGETKLIKKDADTEIEHQINRRTEFKVLKYKPTKKETATKEEEQLQQERLEQLEPETVIDEDKNDDYGRFFEGGESF